MFCNLSAMKRLIKTAFKTGLRMAQTEDTYYLSSREWEWEIETEFMPKEIKGLLIELTGILPEKGESFLCTKGSNQKEEWVTNHISIEGYTEELSMTRLIMISEIGKEINMLQKNDGEIVLVEQKYIAMQDNSELMKVKGESQVADPVSNGEKLMWLNNVSRFTAPIMKNIQDLELARKLNYLELT